MPYRIWRGGLTEASFTPPAGEIWRPIAGYIILNTGATAGSRRVFISIRPKDGSNSFLIMDTNSQTNINAEYVALLQDGNGTGSYFSANHYIVGNDMQIGSGVSVQSGDTVSIMLMIEVIKVDEVKMSMV